MIYTISNGTLTVRVDSLGAQLRSVKGAGGREYLWQGDERYWVDSSPLLFPYIARLYGGGYSYRGQRYSMGIHGFAAGCEFEAGDIRDNSVSLLLCESGQTLCQYPFSFRLKVTYRLEGSVLTVSYSVENRDEKPMPFAIGGHPGFSLPFVEGTEFEDYYLSFAESCEPRRVGFTGELFLSGEDSAYPLEAGKIIRLSHSLFDEDAVILKNTAKSVTLGSDRTKTRLRMDFEGFDFFGIWHAPHTDAPYVCLEPWTSLPSRQGVVEELTEKDDMIMLQPGQSCEKQWWLSIWEE